MTAYEIYEKYHLPINCKMVNHKNYPDRGLVDVWFEFDDYRYHRCLNHNEFLTLKNRRLNNV